MGKQSDRIAKHRKNEADFSRPAARQHGQKRRLRRNTETGAKSLAAGHALGALDCRMADEHGAQTIALKKRYFERQQGQHHIEVKRHGAGTPGATGPHLGRNVVDGDDPRRDALEAPRDAMRKIGAVDQHDRIGLNLHRIVRGLSHARQDFRNARHHFAQAHHRRGIERIKALQTLRRHRFAADANDLHGAAGQRLERGHQLRTKLVAGGFAAHQHQG